MNLWCGLNLLKDCCDVFVQLNRFNFNLATSTFPVMCKLSKGFTKNLSVLHKLLYFTKGEVSKDL